MHIIENPSGFGIEGSVNIGNTYPGSISNTNLPVSREIGSPKSISIKPKNTEVVVEGGVPDVPLPVPFPEPINSVALIVQGMINSMIRPEKTLRLYENFFIGMIFNSLR